MPSLWAAPQTFCPRPIYFYQTSGREMNAREHKHTHTHPYSELHTAATSLNTSHTAKSSYLSISLKPPQFRESVSRLLTVLSSSSGHLGCAKSNDVKIFITQKSHGVTALLRKRCESLLVSRHLITPRASLVFTCLPQRGQRKKLRNKSCRGKASNGFLRDCFVLRQAFESFTQIAALCCLGEIQQSAETAVTYGGWETFHGSTFPVWRMRFSRLPNTFSLD